MRINDKKKVRGYWSKTSRGTWLTKSLGSTILEKVGRERGGSGPWEVGRGRSRGERDGLEYGCGHGNMFIPPPLFLPQAPSPPPNAHAELVNGSSGHIYRGRLVKGWSDLLERFNSVYWCFDFDLECLSIAEGEVIYRERGRVKKEKEGVEKGGGGSVMEVLHISCYGQCQVPRVTPT